MVFTNPRRWDLLYSRYTLPPPISNQSVVHYIECCPIPIPTPPAVVSEGVRGWNAETRVARSQLSPSLLEKMSVRRVVSSPLLLLSSIEFALPLHKWIRRSLSRKSQENERGERERGLFIERGRKPECAADKELAKSGGGMEGWREWNS